MNFRSLILGFLFGAIVTAGLFYLMQELIRGEQVQPPPQDDSEPIRITRDKKPPEEPRTNRELPEPITDDPPPPPSPVPDRPTRGRTDGPTLTTPPVGPVGPGDLPDGTGVPTQTIRVSPVYPRRMAERGIEGDVTVEFTITVEGTVVNPRVISSTNPGFEQAALNAVSRWRYRPRLVNGQPVEQTGVRVTLQFRLTEDD